MGRAADDPGQLAGDEGLHVSEPDPPERGGHELPVLAGRQPQPHVLDPARRRGRPGRRPGRWSSSPASGPYIKYDTNGDRHDPLRLHERAIRQRSPTSTSTTPPTGRAASSGPTARASASLGTAIAPSQADTVYDTPRKAWVHDVAHRRRGRPVSCSPPSRRQRATTATCTRAGRASAGRRARDHRRRRLDQRRRQGAVLQRRHHARPRGPAHRLPLAPPVSGVYEVETWRTPDGGATWSSPAGHGGARARRTSGPSRRAGSAALGRHERALDARDLPAATSTTRRRSRPSWPPAATQPPIADAALSPRTRHRPLPVSLRRHARRATPTARSRARAGTSATARKGRARG